MLVVIHPLSLLAQCDRRGADPLRCTTRTLTSVMGKGRRLLAQEAYADGSGSMAGGRWRRLTCLRKGPLSSGHGHRLFASQGVRQTAR
jgi:hypothetical protein